MAATAEGCDTNKEGTKEGEIAVPLKYLSNLWRTLDIPLIIREVSLTLSWSANFVITSLEKRLVTAEQGDKPEVRDDSPKATTFKTTDCKLYVPLVTLSAENDNKLIEQLKTGFKRTVKWNEYKSEMSNETENNNFHYLIHPKVTNANRLFVLSFKNEHEYVITSVRKSYLPSGKIKDFKVLIDGKRFLEISVKNKEEAYEQMIEMSRNNDYATSNLLDYEYFSKHCKLIVIDLTKKIELENPDSKQQINFIGRLERERNATKAI